MSMPPDPGPPWQQRSQSGSTGGIVWKTALQSITNIPQALQQIYQMLVMRFPGGGQTMASGSASTTGTSSVALISPVSGKAIQINSYALVNAGASDTAVSMQDGSGGTTLWQDYVAAGTGVRFTTLWMPMFKTSSGNGLYFEASASTTTLYVSAAGFAA